MKKKKLWCWMLLIPVILAAVLSVVFFRDAILIRIAPKAVLTEALTDVFSQLQERFRDDPLLIVAKTIDPEGKYTADVDLSTENKLLGSVSYDMRIQTNSDSHQLYAQGSAVTSKTQLNLSCYLDPEFMAVSSNDLLGGNFYGITYDTFQEDIRSIPLLSFFISQNILSQWDASLQDIQKKISQNYSNPQIPEISEQDIQTLLLGILAMPCEIEKTSISAENSFIDCRAISYSVSGEQINTILAATPYAEDGVVEVTFFLYENTLIKIQIKSVSGDRSAIYALNLGPNPAKNTLSLQGINNSSGVFENFNLSVETQRSEDRYTETWHLSRTADGIIETKSLDFDYKLSNGSMDLTINNAVPTNLYLTETENGLRIKTEHFENLMQIFQENTTPSADNPISCTMNISKGSEITTPVYKNLDQWSLEDFWTLLNGVGSLFGIQLYS